MEIPRQFVQLINSTAENSRSFTYVRRFCLCLTLHSLLIFLWLFGLLFLLKHADTVSLAKLYSFFNGTFSSADGEIGRSSFLNATELGFNN